VIPVVQKSDLEIWPINWLGLHRDYLVTGEMEVITALVCSVEAKSMIEFGCRDGRTARVLLHNVPTLEYYLGIDVPPEYQPGLTHQRAEMCSDPGYYASIDPRFELMIRERGSLDIGPQDLGPCDAAFIDGDHSERVVSHDSDLARALVKPGGIIIWHDYHNDTVVDVKKVLDRLHDNEGWPIRTIEGTWLAYRRT